MRDPAKQPEELVEVCRLLRTKTAYGDRGGDWRRGDSTTAVYWCLNTMEPVGPDDGYVHPHRCARGRACFEPEE
jgi:hypothetical protein